MLKAITKHPLPLYGEASVSLTYGYEFLSIHYQYGVPTIFVLTNPMNPSRTFRVVAVSAMHSIESSTHLYLGSVVDPNSNIDTHYFIVEN